MGKQLRPAILHSLISQWSAGPRLTRKKAAAARRTDNKATEPTRFQEASFATAPGIALLALLFRAGCFTAGGIMLCREHANSWGLTLRLWYQCRDWRCGIRDSAAERALERAVQDGRADVEKWLYCPSVSAHLLLLDHPPRHDFVDTL